MKREEGKLEENRRGKELKVIDGRSGGKKDRRRDGWINERNIKR